MYLRLTDESECLADELDSKIDGLLTKYIAPFEDRRPFNL